MKVFISNSAKVVEWKDPNFDMLCQLLPDLFSSKRATVSVIGHYKKTPVQKKLIFKSIEAYEVGTPLDAEDKKKILAALPKMAKMFSIPLASTPQSLRAGPGICLADNGQIFAVCVRDA